MMIPDKSRELILIKSIEWMICKYSEVLRPRTGLKLIHYTYTMDCMDAMSFQNFKIF